MAELDADGTVVARYQLGPSLVDGTALESAEAGLNQRDQWEVRPVLKAGAPGIDTFNAAAAQCNPPSSTCPTGQLAVTIDGRVIIAPTIQVADFERDQITISGNYNEHEARTIAVLLDSGPLPAALGRCELGPPTAREASEIVRNVASAPLRCAAMKR